MMRRGKIKDGFLADLVIFDKDKIQDKASVANPNQFSQGIDYVFVNGEIACKNQHLKFKNGRQIKIQAARVE